MKPDIIRQNRIAELTRMALRGAKLEEIEIRAKQMVSPKTAEEYVKEVQRRLVSMREKTANRVMG